MMSLSRTSLFVIGVLIIGSITFASAKNTGFKMNTLALPTGSGNKSMTIKQNDSPKLGQDKEAPEKYELLLKARDTLVKAGRPVFLDVSVGNNSQETIFIVRSISINDDEIEVKDGKGEIVPLSDEARKALESARESSRIVIEIKPREEAHYEYNVSVLYSLPAGDTYTIKLRRSILLADKTHFIEVESNPVKVTIK